MRRITAAPIVKRPQAKIGAPGLTDYIYIYVARELSNLEARTVIRHEQSHVWAQHNLRFQKGMNIEVWKMACEVEIARNIYNEQDLINITHPKSRLFGGVRPDSFKSMPDDLLVAEDIYEWLMENEDAQPSHKLSNMCCADCSAKPTPLQLISSSAPMKRTKKKINLLENFEEVLSQAEEDAKKIANNMQQVEQQRIETQNAPPSLASELDALLRVRHERVRSYRRLSRRNEDSSIILAAHPILPKAPLVEIFIDRSGSFNAEKTEKAETTLKDILSHYGTSIRQDVFYFGGNAISQKDNVPRGGTPYPLIYQHLLKSRPKVAVVITDDDPVFGDVRRIDNVSVLCIPVGCANTQVANALGGKDVSMS